MEFILTHDVKTIFEAETTAEFTSKDLYKLFRAVFMSRVVEWRTATVREDPGRLHPTRNELRQILENVLVYMKQRRNSNDFNPHRKYSADIYDILSTLVLSNDPIAIYEEMVGDAADNLNAPRVQVNRNNNMQFRVEMDKMFGSIQNFFESNVFDSFAELAMLQNTLWISSNLEETNDPQPTREDIAGFFTSAVTEMRELLTNRSTHFYQYSEDVIDQFESFLTENNTSIMFDEIVSFMGTQAAVYSN